jgi:leader peptidase (prepilin peptidase)/N-methyltransferase
MLGGHWAAVQPLVMQSVQGMALGWLVLASVRIGATAFFRFSGRIGKNEEAMGIGDEHLLSGIGAVLGPSAVLWSLCLAAMQGTVAGLVLLLRRPGEGEHPSGLATPGAPATDNAGDDNEDDWTPPQGALPFGPFLALGAIEFTLWGHLLPSMDVIQLVRDIWATRQ